MMMMMRGGGWECCPKNISGWPTQLRLHSAPPLYHFVVYHSGSRIWKSASMQLVQSCTLPCTLSQQGIPLDIWSVQLWILYWNMSPYFADGAGQWLCIMSLFFLILCLRFCLWSCLFVVFCVIWSEAYCRQAVQDKRCWWVSEWTGPVSGLHQHQQELLLFAAAWKYYLHQQQQELLLIAAVSGTTTICISVEILFTSVSTGNPTTCSSIKKYFY